MRPLSFSSLSNQPVIIIDKSQCIGLDDVWKHSTSVWCLLLITTVSQFYIQCLWACWICGKECLENIDTSNYCWWNTWNYLSIRIIQKILQLYFILFYVRWQYIWTMHAIKLRVISAQNTVFLLTGAPDNYILCDCCSGIAHLCTW